MGERVDLAGRTPGIYRAMGELAQRTQEAVDPVLHELVKIRASQINSCAFCLDMHTRDARAAGETEQRLHALCAWREAPFFTERERAALELTEAITLVHRDQVPDDVYERARAVLDEDELAAVVWGIVAINAWNRIAITTRAVPGTDPRVPDA
ncbi:carboxymuconolactone decarboxylase family protein [Salinifilum aidingensis]